MNIDQRIKETELRQEVLQVMIDAYKSEEPNLHIQNKLLSLMRQNEDFLDDTLDATIALNVTERELIEERKKNRELKKELDHYRAIMKALKRQDLPLPVDQIN